MLLSIHRTKVFTSVVLASSLLVEPTGLVLAQAPAAPAAPLAATSNAGTLAKPDASLQTSQPLLLRSILVFPSNNDAGAVADAAGIAGKLDSAVQFRLNAVGRFKVTYFSPHLAAVERASDDKLLSADTIAGPFVDATKAGPIAEQVSTDGYMITNIESYTVDAATRHVTMGVSASIYDTATNSNLRTIVRQVTAVPIASNDDTATVAQSAVNEAAGQLVRALNQEAPAPARMSMNSTQVHRASPAKSILGIILGAALLYVIFHKSGGSSSSNVGTTNGGTTTGNGTSGNGTSGNGTSGNGTSGNGTTTGNPPPPPI